MNDNKNEGSEGEALPLNEDVLGKKYEYKYIDFFHRNLYHYFTQPEIYYILQGYLKPEELRDEEKVKAVIESINPLCFKRYLKFKDKANMTAEDLLLRQQFLGRTRRFRNKMKERNKFNEIVKARVLKYSGKVLYRNSLAEKYVLQEMKEKGLFDDILLKLQGLHITI
jgi:hypothetical protein